MPDITRQAQAAVLELVNIAGLTPGQIFVVGCSTSEVMGQRIGTAGTREAAQDLLDGILPVLSARGVYLAVQCCEHLNRALVVPRECMEKYGLEEVCVAPQPHAGGSLAALYYTYPGMCVVESIRAHAGMDIGGTLIGMHLKAVAVPVRLSVGQIGQAPILCAKTRPKLIGGVRAEYPD